MGECMDVMHRGRNVFCKKKKSGKQVSAQPSISTLSVVDSTTDFKGLERSCYAPRSSGALEK